MDDLEDVMKDEEVIKEMKEVGVGQTKGRQWKSGFSLLDATEVAKKATVKLEIFCNLVLWTVLKFKMHDVAHDVACELVGIIHQDNATFPVPPSKLHQSICNFKKLRHLDIDHTSRLKTLLKGIGKLTSLLSLSHFLIGTKDASCTLGDLKYLNNLRGSVKIEGLNGADIYASEDDMEAVFGNIEHLTIDVIDAHLMVINW
ncbi:putative disease resistance protein RGA4 [Tanacetum coccineum]|uniref:Disease resistance protein RGA4 n=1 Tax=Tanacetum coccineum TaxID=301880 RepID=A0ABQ4ZXC8_9ASTR